MHVVHIESGRHLYGGARQVLHLVAGLGRIGVRNTLICARGAEIAAAAAGVQGGETLELPMRGDADLALALRLRRALRALRPDIVHAHSRRGADVFTAIASLGAAWKSVVTRRVDNPEPRRWARAKYRRYDAVIAISRAVEDQLVADVGVPRSKVHRVASAVDTAAIRPLDTGPRAERAAALRREFGWPGDTLIAAVAAQLIPRKNHAVLLAALPEAFARQPRLRVVFFGRGPEATAVAREIERRGLGDRVILAGHRDDLSEWWPVIDIALHPAHREGMGLAVLEAMSAGCAVVASAAGGIVDAVVDGESGLLVPPHNAAAWRDAIVRLADSAALRGQLGRAARQRVEERFSIERMALGNLQVYQMLAGVQCAAAAGAIEHHG